MNRKNFTRSAFFKDLPWFVKTLTLFIRGDLVFLLPLILVIIITYFFSMKVGLISTGLYLTIRYFGEMIYWIHQQFSARTYRPNDFGFKNLDNNAIYILYQTFAIVLSTVGAALVVFTLLYFK